MLILIGLGIAVVGYILFAVFGSLVLQVQTGTAEFLDVGVVLAFDLRNPVTVVGMAILMFLPATVTIMNLVLFILDKKTDIVLGWDTFRNVLNIFTIVASGIMVAASIASLIGDASRNISELQGGAAFLIPYYIGMILVGAGNLLNAIGGKRLD